MTDAVALENSTLCVLDVSDDMNQCDRSAYAYQYGDIRVER